MSTEVDNYLEHLGLEVGDDLKHFGVKGMKWGVTRDRGGSGGSGGGDKGPTRKEKRAAANAEIEGARTRQRERSVELERQAFKTYSANGEKATKAALAKYDKMELDLLNNPDAATAARLTSGEKIAVGVQWGILTVGMAGLTAAKVAAARR